MIWFFEEIFLLANINIEEIFRIPFLFLININIKFTELEKLTSRTYTILEVLSITSKV